jgi:hypothetical protein
MKLHGFWQRFCWYCMGVPPERERKLPTTWKIIWPDINGSAPSATDEPDYSQMNLSEAMEAYRVWREGNMDYRRRMHGGIHIPGLP